MARWAGLAVAVCLCGCGSKTESLESAGISTPAAASTAGDQASPQSSALRSSDPAIQALLDEAGRLNGLGQQARALGVLSRGIADFPEVAALWRARAILNSRGGDAASALTDYMQAIRLSPNDATLHDEAGFWMFGAGRQQEALKYLSRAVELDPQFTRALNHLALVRVARGEHSQAIELLDKALLADATLVDARINRGFALYQLGKFDEALQEYDRALERDEKAINAWNNKGLVFFQQQRYNDAAGAFTKCILLNKQNPKYYEHRRLSYEKLGMHAEAQLDARRANDLLRTQALNLEIARRPDRAAGYLARGRKLLAENKTDEALRDFENAVRLEPGSWTMWMARAEAWFAKAEYERVVSDCDRVLELHPHYAAWSLRGDACLKLGRTDAALEDFARAKRLDPGVAEAYLRKAEELEALGQADEANDFRRRATELHPDVKLTPSAN